MNSLVALPIAAAVPTAMPALPTADGHPDAELIALADQCVSAWKAWCQQDRLVNKMDEQASRLPLPQVLEWREEDAHLGLPVNKSDKLKSRELAWDCEYFVGKLRPAKWPVSTMLGDNEDMTLFYRLVEPSPAARARADEIIAAFDSWWASERYPRGFRTAKRKANKLYREYERLEERTSHLRATTIEGMMAKVRCARAYADGLEISDLQGCAEVMALSLFEDIGHLAGRA